MHLSSYLKMEWFKNIYLADRKDEKLKILDIGSCNMGGSYRPLFSEPAWSYTGMDMAQESGVDIVVRDAYNWKEIASAAYDVVISGQAFEHMPYFWLVMQEVARVLKSDGICCIIAPSSGPEHRCPVDCYRFYTDGMIAMADYAHLNVLHAFTGEGIKDPGRDIFKDNNGVWHDSVLIAQKGAYYRIWNGAGNGRKRAVVWGTGTLAVKLWNRIPNLDMEIAAFIDNDKTKQGKLFRGIRILAPEELHSINYDRIVICSHFIKEIWEQLTCGICEYKEKIFTYKDFI